MINKGKHGKHETHRSKHIEMHTNGARPYWGRGVLHPI